MRKQKEIVGRARLRAPFRAPSAAERRELETVRAALLRRRRDMARGEQELSTVEQEVARGVPNDTRLGSD